MSIKALLTKILQKLKTESASNIVTAGTGFTVASTNVRKYGDVVYIRFYIYKTDQTAFAQGRTTGLGTVASGYRPAGINFSGVVPASSAVNYTMNRWANIDIATDGTIYVDCQGYNDVKELYCRAVYVAG